MNPPANELIAETKRQFSVAVVGTYLIAGFFWFVVTVGSIRMPLDCTDAAHAEAQQREQLRFFLLSIVVMWVSTGIWEALTGWYADKFRRRTSLSIGFLACGIGWLLMIVAVYLDTPTRTLIWSAGISIWALGPALQSGADEAWLVDRCKFLSPIHAVELTPLFRSVATAGIIMSSLGAFASWAVFMMCGALESESPASSQLPITITASCSAAISIALFLYSWRFKEEYWTHPKYQTNESLFAFLKNVLMDCAKTPFLWFLISWVGAKGFSYLWFSTFWPYLANLSTNSAMRYDPMYILYFILIQLVSGFIGRRLSPILDCVAHPWMRFVIAATVYSMPLILLLPLLELVHADGVGGTQSWLAISILAVATLGFRTAFSWILGTLTSMGQHAINSDERRATLISMVSALSAVIISVPFLVALIVGGNHKLKTVVEWLWTSVGACCFAALVVGGFFLGRQSHTEPRNHDA